MHRSESFDFHGAPYRGARRVLTLLPCSCSTALSLRAGLVSTAHPLCFSAATDRGPLLCHLAESTAERRKPVACAHPCLAALTPSYRSLTDEPTTGLLGIMVALCHRRQAVTPLV